MRVVKLLAVVSFAATLTAFLILTPSVTGQTGPTEAPAGFDNQTNDFEPQGSPVEPNTTPTPNTFETDKFIFNKVDEISDGLGPVYNAQSCRECHQNPVSGGVSQIFELRAGHSRPDGTFVDPPGGSLINDRAINADIQERVPDGPRIVFVGDSQTISVMGFDGGQYGSVGNSPALGQYPAFSPDGTRIAFNSSGNIWVMNNDGTNRQQLTTASSDLSPAWSPDGTKIAFSSHRTGTYQIFTMNADGTGQTNISNNSVVNDGQPAYSPDGTKIAFTRAPVSSLNPLSKIWTMNSGGTGQAQLTLGTGNDERPSYSPDGTMIAFSTNRNGNYEIYKIPAAGGTATRLTNNTASDRYPSWSPDNSAIAFASTQNSPGGQSHIWTMAPDGSGASQIFAGTGDLPNYSKDQGETVRTFRSSLNVLGDGFVEATDDSTFVSIQSGQPVGMRGTIIYVPSFEAPSETRVGRFGWKDQLASLLSFSSDAYLNEMGITNRFNLVENTSLGRSVAAFDTVPDNQPCDSDGANCGEDGEEDIDAFARFMRSTKAPPRDRNVVPVDSSDPGSALFDSLSCSVCHVRNITTTANSATSFNGGMFVVGNLANKTFHPFGDFLLHDIGTGDGIAQAGGETTKNMVRTAPLWGVRTRTRLMHDGGSSSSPSNSGAQSFTFNEAILRHAGQATSSRTAYQALTALQKAQLIHFLKSL